jgi:hypothetical protein
MSNILEDVIIHNHHRENLKSYILQIVCKSRKKCDWDPGND